MKYNTKLALGISALMLLGATFAFAAPAKTSTIFACLSSSGTLTKVSTKAPKCPKGTTSMSWNQTGPTGPKGDQGLRGPQGLKGDSADPGTQRASNYLYTLQSPDGSKSYEVRALPFAEQALLVDGVYWRLDSTQNAGHFRDALGSPVFASTDCTGEKSFVADPEQSPKSMTKYFSGSIATQLWDTETWQMVVTVPSSLTFENIRSYKDNMGICQSLSNLATSYEAILTVGVASLPKSVWPSSSGTSFSWSAFRRCLGEDGVTNSSFGCLPNNASKFQDYRFLVEILQSSSSKINIWEQSTYSAAYTLSKSPAELVAEYSLLPFKSSPVTKPSVSDWQMITD
jgi:hypothetical protein